MAVHDISVSRRASRVLPATSPVRVIKARLAKQPPESPMRLTADEKLSSAGRLFGVVTGDGDDIYPSRNRLFMRSG